MPVQKNIHFIALIAGQFAFGVALSFVFFGISLINHKWFGNSYASFIIRFYSILSIVFFIAVFSVGIFGALRFGKSYKIARAILFSFLFWILSIIIYAATFSYFPDTLNLGIIPLYNFSRNRNLLPLFIVPRKAI